jgi:F0F1-type ATP synthase assembly protein I
MKKEADSPVDDRKVASSQTPPSSPQKLNVGREIVDTTWRMTVPVVIFAFIGIFADIQLETKPWLTFLGVIIGFYFAYALIKKQIER